MVTLLNCTNANVFAWQVWLVLGIGLKKIYFNEFILFEKVIR